MFSSSRTRTPAAILFDWDNTLFDETAIVDIVRDALLKEFATPPHPSREEMWDAWHSDRNRFFSYFPTPTLDDFFLRFIPMYDQIHLDHGTLHEGVREMLAELKAMGIKIAIASNKPQAILDAEIRHLGLDRTFDAVVGLTPGLRKKPEPDVIIKALRELKVPRQHAWYVGDTMDDVHAARSLGLPHIVLGEPGCRLARNHYKDAHPAFHPQYAQNISELRTLFARQLGQHNAMSL